MNVDLASHASSSETSVQTSTTQRAVRQEDSRISQIRDQVLETIRQHIPIATLFTPELKIDLGVFIKDQMFIRRIAEFLDSLTETDAVNTEWIAKQFEPSDLLPEIKAMFKQDSAPYLTLFYEACSDVLNKKPYSSNFKSAIEGRIFTLKNALLAQHTPQAIVNSQMQCKLSPQNIVNVQSEGASFIRESLHIHLNSLKEKENTSFKELLMSTAEQLIPFVQKITRIYLQENGKKCPDNPLVFRNSTGYNYHGLVAATIMESCLHVLGYKTRLICRSDLEPKVTLATAHSIVEVTAPDHSRYIIDPSYIQFHKDVCLDDKCLPTSPVLVLSESEVDQYIEDNLMVYWKASAELVKRKGDHAIEILTQRDQHIPFIIKSFNLPTPFIPTNLEVWVRKALKRVWDAKTYSPILSNQGFRDIFIGEATLHKTHDYIKAMGIASLCQHSSIAEVEKRLKELIQNPDLKGSNSLEALSLIVQLPTKNRFQYASLFDVDPRVEEIGLTLNAYFRSLRKNVNPEGKDKSVLYGCSGADCASVMLATDAQDFTFVDLTTISYSRFSEALAHLKSLTSHSERALKNQLEQNSDFLTGRLRNGRLSSHYLNDGTYIMKDLELKLLLDLRAVGVDLNKIVLTSNPQGIGVRIDFPWQYHGAPLLRNRSITFITADITNPDAYPPLLKTKLAEGFDIFYMKAAFFAPIYYPQFLPHLAKSLKEGGWLMATDKTATMEIVDPEVCLKQNNLTFALHKTKEIKMMENLIYPASDPLFVVPVLQYPRLARLTGSDLTYWALLSLRQKTKL